MQVTTLTSLRATGAAIASPRRGHRLTCAISGSCGKLEESLVVSLAVAASWSHKYMTQKHNVQVQDGAASLFLKTLQAVTTAALFDG
jgi:hypothetical protein